MHKYSGIVSLSNVADKVHAMLLNGHSLNVRPVTAADLKNRS